MEFSCLTFGIVLIAIFGVIFFWGVMQPMPHLDISSYLNTDRFSYHGGSMSNDRPYHGGCISCSYNGGSFFNNEYCRGCRYKNKVWGLPDLSAPPWKKKSADKTSVKYCSAGKIECESMVSESPIFDCHCDAGGVYRQRIREWESCPFKSKQKPVKDTRIQEISHYGLDPHEPNRHIYKKLNEVIDAINEMRKE